VNVTISADTKDALARDVPEAVHCRAALLHGLSYYGSTTSAGTTNFRTQRPAIARLFRSLLGEKGGSIQKHHTARLYRSPAYDIAIPKELAGVPKRPTARCDRRMEVRAAFLSCGSLASPAHGYHLEFVCADDERATRVAGLLAALGFPPKHAVRKGKKLLYYKDAEAIVGVLTIAGAYSAVLHMEDVRAMKETKNRIHRLVNTEAANVDRAAGAAAAQREAIAYLVDAYGLRNLSSVLREAAQLRLAHPEETLAELGRRCRPPVGKSTINGRIATLVRLVRRLQSPGKNREGSKSAAGKHEPAHL
jgi:DNA-binding transcriptional regulator WhiA